MQTVRFNVGDLFQLTKCRITAKTEHGLDVKLLPSKMAAFIPKMHLSDYHSNCDALWGMYSVGDILEDVMYFGKTNVIVSLKKLSVDTASINHFI